MKRIVTFNVPSEETVVPRWADALDRYLDLTGREMAEAAVAEVMERDGLSRVDAIQGLMSGLFHQDTRGFGRLMVHEEAIQWLNRFWAAEEKKAR